MKNIRSIKRRHLFFYLQITEAKQNKLLGYVVDITSKGLKIVSEDALVVGSVLDLKMNLPNDIGRKKELLFSAKVIWCGADVNSDFFAVGLEMVDIDKDHIAIIEEMVNEYGFEDLE